MQLFYTPNIEKTDKHIVFPKDESRHIAKVLRKSAGDILKVTNGKGFLFTAEITTADSKQCLAKIIEVEVEKPKKYQLHLVARMRLLLAPPAVVCLSVLGLRRGG